jgi:sugar phosphate isomerase/epimerase
LDAALGEIGALGPEISHVHVFAWDREKNRYPLADRKDEWRTILKAMPETRWQGERFAMIEFVRGDSPDQFRDDAVTFRQLLEEVQDRPAGAASPL